MLPHSFDEFQNQNTERKLYEAYNVTSNATVGSICGRLETKVSYIETSNQNILAREFFGRLL